MLTVRARFGFWPLTRPAALAVTGSGAAALLAYGAGSVQLAWPDLWCRILAVGMGLGVFTALLAVGRVYQPDLGILLRTRARS